MDATNSSLICIFISFNSCNNLFIWWEKLVFDIGSMILNLHWKCLGKAKEGRKIISQEKHSRQHPSWPSHEFQAVRMLSFLLQIYAIEKKHLHGKRRKKSSFNFIWEKSKFESDLNFLFKEKAVQSFIFRATSLSTNNQFRVLIFFLQNFALKLTENSHHVNHGKCFFRPNRSLWNWIHHGNCLVMDYSCFIVSCNSITIEWFWSKRKCSLIIISNNTFVLHSSWQSRWKDVSIECLTFSKKMMLIL